MINPIKLIRRYILLLERKNAIFSLIVNNEVPGTRIYIVINKAQMTIRFTICTFGVVIEKIRVKQKTTASLDYHFEYTDFYSETYLSKVIPFDREQMFENDEELLNYVLPPNLLPPKSTTLDDSTGATVVAPSDFQSVSPKCLCQR